MTMAPPPPTPPPPACKWTALEKRLANYSIEGVGRDPQVFLDGLEPQVRAYVDQELLEKAGVKLQLSLHVGFFKQNPKPEDTLENQKVSHYFWSKTMSIYRGSEYSVEDLFPYLIQAIDEYQRYGSGYVIEDIKKLDVRIVICKPLRGSCTTELPNKLRNTHSRLNINNTYEYCFKYCVRAALKEIPRDANPNRVSKYQDDCGLNFEGMDFPAATRDIDRFERQNPGYAINIYCYEEEEVIPHRISKVQGGRWINLLLYNGHYFLIRDLNRMLHDLTKNKGRLHFCPRCLMHKSSKELLNEHMRLCEGREPTKIKMPDSEHNILKFSNIHRTLRAPVTVYADFESITEKIDSEGEKDETKSYTKPLQKHTPCGYGIQVVRNCCGTPKYDDPEIYRGSGPNSNVVEKFLNSISQIALDHQDNLNNPKTMKEPSCESNDCHICKKKIQEDKVMDHCHICGNFRGYAHNKCNQAFRLNRDINVVFHNLRKYDGHLIMEMIGTIAKLQGFEIDVIARAMEDYISFSLHHKKEEPGDFVDKINFIDSVQFLNNPLDGLVSNMEKEKFTGMKQQWSGDKLDKLLRKGVYPYDFMDSWENFEEPLPPKDAFSSLLSGKGISDADHEQFQRHLASFQIFQHRPVPRSLPKDRRCPACRRL